jgi:two-component system nitrogen regulation sensor histidine kinase NtrY
MPATVTSISPSASEGSPPVREQPRRPFRDNPRLILAGIAVLLAALLAILTVANNTARLAPDFLTELVLYALTAADLTMLVALFFVLARNIVKLVVERRRGLPFARFRAKLVALLLGMTLVPTIVVLIVGSELIQSNIDNWFNAPMEEVLSSANRVAGDYYQERRKSVSDHAERLARILGGAELGTDIEAVRALIGPDITARPTQIVEVYRVVQDTSGTQSIERIDNLSAAPPSSQYSHAEADRLAASTLTGRNDRREDAVEAGREILHAAAVVNGKDGQPTAVVVATDLLGAQVIEQSRHLTRAFESYNQLRVLRRPLTGVYLSFFVMVALLILIGAVWMGSYLAKRITRPVQMLAAAAREIGAGHLDQRVEPQSGDEFGALTEAFNTMADELAASRSKVERSTFELERKHVEVEGRRRYIETILERITTGVVSLDAGGLITTINSAAARLLGLDRAVVGKPSRDVFERDELQPLARLLGGASRGRQEPSAQELALFRDGQELHLAAVATALVGESGAPEGVVLVLDDVTPLIRTQKVAAWREVARRLAHEIKNPLTPIQLSAERLRRHFAGGPPGARALVDECTKTIVGEVESLKGLVDEFSQFARMPAPRAVPTDLHRLITDTLTLYDGLFSDVRIDRRFDAAIPLVRLDAEQIRRVMINLVDNAVEAMERQGAIVVETQRDGSNNIVRVVVADDGPGIPPAERDKLFLPYYSTKQRGSGLGLAIVRRIIAEHGGSIEVADNTPRGTRFTIELPC